MILITMFRDTWLFWKATIAYLKLLNTYCGMFNINDSLIMHLYVSADMTPVQSSEDPGKPRGHYAWLMGSVNQGMKNKPKEGQTETGYTKVSDTDKY